MHDIAARLEEQGLYVALTEDARQKLAEIGFDPQFGASAARAATLHRKPAQHPPAQG